MSFNVNDRVRATEDLEYDDRTVKKDTEGPVTHVSSRFRIATVDFEDDGQETPRPVTFDQIAKT